MAKPIVVTLDGKTSNFGHKKLSRKALYGRRKREVVDRGGAGCERASLTDDGRFMLRSGMTAQGYFTGDDRWIPNADLVGLGGDGKPVERMPATLGAAQPLSPATATDLLDLQVASVYMLDADEIDDDLAKRLDAGELFTCPFNYRADYHAETLILLKNQQGYFGVVGVPAPAQWTDPVAAQPVIAEAEEDLFEDDLDFEMF